MLLPLLLSVAEEGDLMAVEAEATAADFALSETNINWDRFPPFFSVYASSFLPPLSFLDIFAFKCPVFLFLLYMVLG